MTALVGVAGEHYAAAELARRGYLVTLTRGNAPGIDVLAYDPERKSTTALQVKAAAAGKQPRGTWLMSSKDEDADAVRSDYFIFVYLPADGTHPEYWIVPSKVVAATINADHKAWLAKPGAKGQQRSTSNSMRQFKVTDDKWLGRWEQLASKQP